MKKNIPQGSKIKIERFGIYELITIPYAKRSIMKYFVGIFLLFWFGGWFIGFKNTIQAMINGKADLFIVFWLCGWTIGGLLVIAIIFRIFRPSVSESILFMPSSIKYDSGIPAFDLDLKNSNQKEVLKSLFPKRTVIEITKEQLKTLSLRETDSGNRLTIDVGSNRMNIAVGVNEIEREWIYKILKEKYN